MAEKEQKQKHQMPIRDIRFAWVDGMGLHHGRCTCGWEAAPRYDVVLVARQFAEHIENEGVITDA